MKTKVRMARAESRARHRARARQEVLPGVVKAITQEQAEKAVKLLREWYMRGPDDYPLSEEVVETEKFLDSLEQRKYKA